MKIENHFSRKASLIAVGILAALGVSTTNAGDTADKHDHSMMISAPAGLPADVALTGVPMKMSPYDLPHQFRTQLRGDVANSTGTLTIKRVGNDVHYTFAWQNLTSNLMSAHFHNAPQAQVGARAYSVCGVAGESPACPAGTTGSLSGIWKDADFAALDRGDITFAAHSEVYPAPIGELAVYIPASRGHTASAK